jgi:hypothetical protein
MPELMQPQTKPAVPVTAREHRTAAASDRGKKEAGAGSGCGRECSGWEDGYGWELENGAVAPGFYGRGCRDAGGRDGGAEEEAAPADEQF